MSTAKRETKTAVPRLRFPVFRDVQGWCALLLEELEECGWLELGRGNVISAKDMRDTPGAYPVYSSSIKNEGYMGSYGQFMFDEELISWSIDGGGDFFYRPHHKFSVTNVSGYMRLKTDRLLYRFVASQLQSLHAMHTFDYQLKAHPSVIRKLYRLGVPSSAEQQKIADCLTSLDEVIAAQGRKVEALKAHKRGLMQQLFPREGETRPRLRFPEFRDAPEWEAKRLEDVAPLQRGFDLTSSQIEAGDVPVVYSNGVRSYHNVGMASGPGLVTGRSGTIGSLHFIDNGNYWPHNTSLWVTTFKGHDPKFVYYLYAAIGVERFASGSGVPTLNRNDVHAFETRVPEAKREQQRIADCLSSLDTQIAAESNQLAALKTHKQGMMQQLFPVPEAAGA